MFFYLKMKTKRLNYKTVAHFLLVILVFCLFSCSKKKEKESPQYMYNEAKKYLRKGVYSYAAEDFEKIEDEHPFSEEAKNGLIMSAYSYYKAEQYYDSLRVIDYFIQSNPVHDNINYMYYLKSLNYYDQVTSEKKARDVIENADKSLKDVLIYFEKSKYAEDVLRRQKVIETYLSGNEMEIGVFYLKNKNVIGAMNHFNYVIEKYPNSEFVPEAYYRLIEINLILGDREEVEKTFDILKRSYNDTKWFKYGEKIIRKNYGKSF